MTTIQIYDHGSGKVVATASGATWKEASDAALVIARETDIRAFVDHGTCHVNWRASR